MHEEIDVRVELVPMAERHELVMTIDRDELLDLIQQGQIKQLRGELDTRTPDTAPIAFGSIRLEWPALANEK